MKRFGHLVFAARSEIGLKRKNNEDAYGAFPLHGIWCVADGMGGGDDGEIASAAVVQAIDGFCKEYPMPSEGAYSAWEISRGVTAAVNSASSWVFRRAQARRLKGCGSTFVGVVFDATRPADALVLHAGDSRLYRIRGKEIRQITKDHSAAELVGVKKESDLNPMFRGMILRAVGIAESVEVDVTPMSVREGDVVLVCSDGLSRMIPDKKILSIVRDNPHDMNLAAGKLIEAVYSAGAVDNVTAVLISVRELPQAVKEVPSPIPSGNEEECSDDPATHDTSADARTSCRDTELTATVPLCPEAETEECGSIRTENTEVNAAGAAQSLVRSCRRNPLMVALAAGLLFIGLAIALIASFMAGRSEKAAPAPVHSISQETVSAVSDSAALPVSEKEVAPVETKPEQQPVPPRAESVKPTVPVVEVNPPVRKKRTEDSAEEQERKKLADMLKAERAKMLKAEAAEAAVAERCHEAAVALGRICRDRAAFPKFLERMKSVVGSAACANVRMCGQTIASMKPDENGFSASACDLVREMQKFDALLNGKNYDKRFPRWKFGKLAAMDPTSREAYELAADIIVAVAEDGGRR